MKAAFAQTNAFTSQWKGLKLGDADLRTLELQLMAGPETAAVMAGTGGLRKVRFAPPSMRTGKSGATRVCYLWLPDRSFLWLIAIYPKNEKDNLTARERNEVRSMIERLKQSTR